METVKVGQVWQDNDKRRGERRIEILDTFKSDEKGLMVSALVVGTEKETELVAARLVARWSLVKDVPIEPEPKAKVVKKESKYKTREQWLEAAVKEITRVVFKPKDIEVPTVRVSVGWPGGRGKKTGVVGQCFATSSAEDKVAQIFVSPMVSRTLNVLRTLTHELVHAIDDCKDGHKKNFIKIAREIGFEPEWTSSENISEELDELLKGIADKLGPFPHAAIRPDDRPTVQKTYMLKVMCPEDADYFVRMTKGKIEEFGTPYCPCHHEEMVEEEK